MWHCSVCTAENEDSAVECVVCNCSKGDKGDLWQCNNCCQFSPANSGECIVCGVLKESEGAVGKNAGLPPGEQMWKDFPDHLSDDDDKEVTTTTTPLAEIEVWVCQKQFSGRLCNTNNSLDAFRCGQCNAVKPYLKDQLTLSVSQVTAGFARVSVGAPSSPDSATTSGRHSDGATARRDVRTRHISLDVGTHDNRGPGNGSNSGDEASRATGNGGRHSAGNIRRHASLPEQNLPPQLPKREFAYEEDPAMNAWREDPNWFVQDEEVMDFPDQECRIVLVGKTGNGKSSTANTILGLQRRFQVSSAFSSATTKCQRHSTRRFGVQMEVVDTPGLFDTQLDQDTVINEITKCLAVVSPGPHAIVLVLRIGVRFTEEEVKAVEKVNEMFGVQLLRFLVIVFTHGDELERCANDGEREAALKDLLGNAPAKLKELVEKANHRYVVFDNKADQASKNQQVRQLLETIKKLLKVNGGVPFTSELLRTVERHMIRREAELRREHGDGDGRGRRHLGARGFNMYRDMAREEVVQERPLLQKIKEDILPLIQEFVRIFGPFLVQLFKFAWMMKRGGGCCVQ